MPNIHTSPFRTYRDAPTSHNEVAFQLVVQTTDLHIIAEQDLHMQAMEIVQTLRGQLESFMALTPQFATSLVPLPSPENAPEIARRMYLGAQLADVGPMAAVAGTISQMVAEALYSQSPNILVENGGDIFAFSTRERVIGLLPMPEEGVNIGILLEAESFPLAICSSSGRIGHSLSFGKGDLVTVLARDAAFADAAATALANRLQTADDVEQVLTIGEQWHAKGLKGLFVQCGGKIGAWGDIELTQC